MGIYNIIPGLSGSALLVIFDLYEKCLEAISSFFRKPKDSFIFLFPIAIGIIIGTYLFSNVIFFLLSKYYMETYVIFTFFLLGTIPHLFDEATKKGFRVNYLIPFFMAFVSGLILLFLNISNDSFSYDSINTLECLIIGVVLSFSTIIPGISSTVLLSLINLYGLYIYSISTFNINVLIPMGIGFAITTFIISKIVNYLLKRYYGYTYFAILGFSLATIPSLLKIEFVFSVGLFISIVTGLIAFVFTYYSFKVIK